MELKSQVVFYSLYLIACIGMTIPTVMAALPHEASQLNRLGYASRCSFVPWSTLSMIGILLIQVGIIYAVQTLTVHSAR